MKEGGMDELVIVMEVIVIMVVATTNSDVSQNRKRT